GESIYVNDSHATSQNDRIVKYRINANISFVPIRTARHHKQENIMRLQFLLFILIGFGAAAAADTVQSAESQIMTSGQVTFVSGGVAEDSLQRMEALSKDFNL